MPSIPPPGQITVAEAVALINADGPACWSFFRQREASGSALLVRNVLSDGEWDLRVDFCLQPHQAYVSPKVPGTYDESLGQFAVKAERGHDGKPLRISFFRAYPDGPAVAVFEHGQRLLSESERQEGAALPASERETWERARAAVDPFVACAGGVILSVGMGMVRVPYGATAFVVQLSDGSLRKIVLPHPDRNG